MCFLHNSDVAYPHVIGTDVEELLKQRLVWLRGPDLELGGWAQVVTVSPDPRKIGREGACGVATRGGDRSTLATRGLSCSGFTASGGDRGAPTRGLSCSGFAARGGDRRALATLGLLVTCVLRSCSAIVAASGGDLHTSALSITIIRRERGDRPISRRCSRTREVRRGLLLGYRQGSHHTGLV